MFVISKLTSECRTRNVLFQTPNILSMAFLVDMWAVLYLSSLALSDGKKRTCIYIVIQIQFLNKK
jgi:hypothetical protein